jgi:hypothetical protein
MTNPYRSSRRLPPRPEAPEHRGRAPARAAILFTLMILAAPRLALAVSEQEPFGFEPALALCLCCLPAIFAVDCVSVWSRKARRDAGPIPRTAALSRDAKGAGNPGESASEA